MNLYSHDLSLLDFNFSFSDPATRHELYRSDLYGHDGSISASFSTIPYADDNDDGEDEGDGRRDAAKRSPSPPKHRHDGKSPLPFGMDWSPPPRQWDGRNSIWPHDPHTGWSYCVTVPSWTVIPKSRGSEPVVFYRVLIGIQSPDGITTTQGILRRFSDFTKLLAELKKGFPWKNLPPCPPKRMLKMKDKTLLEERRCSLEDWMQKLLSDIELSRSAPLATFLELEAAARSSFYDRNQQVSDPTSLFPTSSDIASDHGNDSSYEISEIGTPRHEMDNSSDLGIETSMAQQDISDQIKTPVRNQIFNRNIIKDNLERFSRNRKNSRMESSTVDREISVSKFETIHGDAIDFSGEQENYKSDGHARRLSAESLQSDLSSVRASEISNMGVADLFRDGSLDLPRTADTYGSSDLQFSRGSLIAFPSDERYKLNRVLTTVQQRLTSAKTDMEDLIARLNQEVAVRQFLTTKVKDLESELETTKQSCKENMEQAVLNERERFTQMQWDIEELRSKRLEMEMELKSEQEEKMRAESTKLAVIEENEMLLQELDVAREQFENLQKQHEELEVKSKAEIKLLVKEVKSLRGSQLEMKQELGRLMKEKLDVERVLQKEKQRMDQINAANVKLLHECEILHSRLQECSVNFLVEEEDKLIVDTSSPSDAIDLLTTSDNRIGLLLAEAQLLAQDVESAIATSDNVSNGSATGKRTSVDELRKMLTDTFIDNARLRKQVNSVIRCALNTYVKSEQDDDEDEEEEEEAPLRKTVLSKFLER